jgi:hypothetical protein
MRKQKSLSKFQMQTLTMGSQKIQRSNQKKKNQKSDKKHKNPSKEVTKSFLKKSEKAVSPEILL